jgi:hypothetical protein
MPCNRKFYLRFDNSFLCFSDNYDIHLFSLDDLSFFLWCSQTTSSVDSSVFDFSWIQYVMPSKSEVSPLHFPYPANKEVLTVLEYSCNQFFINKRKCSLPFYRKMYCFLDIELNNWNSRESMHASPMDIWKMYLLLFRYPKNQLLFAHAKVDKFRLLWILDLFYPWKLDVGQSVRAHVEELKQPTTFPCTFPIHIPQQRKGWVRHSYCTSFSKVHD